MSSWWGTIELNEFGGFQRDWYGPYSSEGEAEQSALSLPKQQELVAETILGVVGRDETRFAEFVNKKRYPSGGSGWFTVKPSFTIKIPATAKGNYPSR